MSKKRSSKEKKLLSIPEIETLIEEVRWVYRQMDERRKKHPLAEYIKHPQIPSKLTESLAIHLINNSFIPQLAGCKARFGEDRVDVFAFKDEKKMQH